MATRLYLHVATNPIANLPTTEQSTNTSVYSLNPVSTNFFMDDQIGTAQVTRPTSGTSSSTGKTFIGRWVSPLLGSTTQIDANTWTVNYAATDAGSGKFPAPSSPGTMWICAYVWRPGTGKVGSNIIDGLSNSGFQIGSTTEKVEHGTFTGAQVTGVQNTDVLCVELWADTSSAGSGWAYRIYFDGTVENTTPAATVSDHAAFIETPQTLTLPLHISKSISETAINVSDSQALLRTKNRPVATETVTVSEKLVGYYARPLEVIAISDAVAKLVTQVSGNHITKTLTDTVTVSAGTLARLTQKIRTASDTITIGAGTLARLKAITKAITESITISESAFTRLAKKIRTATDTITISPETIARKSDKVRTKTETISVSDAVDKLRPLIRSITQTVTTSDSLNRLSGKVRTSMDTVATTEGIQRLLSKFRVLTQTTDSQDSIAKSKRANRAISDQSVSIFDLLNRLKESVKTSMDTIVVTDGLGKLLTKIRSVSESNNISDSVDRTVSYGVKNIEKAITESAISISDALTRLLGKVKALTETNSISESLGRIPTKSRSITETLSILDSVDRVKSGVKAIARSLVDTVTLTEVSLIRLLNKFRTSSDTVATGETLGRQNTKNRGHVDTVVGSETLARLVAKIRTAVDTISISTTLVRLVEKVRTKTETVSVSETLARGRSKSKTLTETVPILDSISRAIGKIRARLESVNISTSLDRLTAKNRAITESIEIADLVDRVKGTLAEIVRIIEESEIVVSDAFYKARTIVETLDVGEMVGRVVTHVSPVNIVKALTDAVNVGLDSLVLKSGKKKSITESNIAILDNAEITRRNKVRKRIETVKITTHVSAVNQKREIVLGLTETVDVGDMATRQTGKTRRIGGPG